MKKFISLLIGVSVLLSSLYIPTYAANESKFEFAPYSKEYEQYLELSDDERAKVNEPFKVDIAKEPDLPTTYSSRSMPTKYDLREHNGVPDIFRDQQNMGLCWAFGSCASLQSYIKFNYNKDYDLSPLHIGWSTRKYFKDGESETAGYTGDINGGGLISQAAAYFYTGKGPVLEKDFPFTNTSEMKYMEDVNVSTAGIRVNDYRIIPYSDYDDRINTLGEYINKIKGSVMSNGALATNIYIDNSGFNTKNSTYSANLNDDSGNRHISNHVVTIIGWDDDFSKDKFINKPQYDGAWLIRNSWSGSGYDYFYVPYEQLLYGSTTIEDAQTELDYDNIYYYDTLGFDEFLGDKNNDTGITYACNVFNKTQGVQELTDVVVSTPQSCQWEIYVNTEGNTSIEGLSPVADGYTPYCGYDTVTLDTPVTIDNDRFAVIVKYITPEVCYNVPVCTNSDNGAESYVSSDGVSWEKCKDGSVASIKAYTKDIDTKYNVSFNKYPYYTRISVKQGDNIIKQNHSGKFYQLLSGDYEYEAVCYGTDEKVSGSFTVKDEDIEVDVNMGLTGTPPTFDQHQISSSELFVYAEGKGTYTSKFMLKFDLGSGTLGANDIVSVKDKEGHEFVKGRDYTFENSIFSVKNNDMINSHNNFNHIDMENNLYPLTFTFDDPENTSITVNIPVKYISLDTIVNKIETDIDELSHTNDVTIEKIIKITDVTDKNPNITKEWLLPVEYNESKNAFYGILKLSEDDETEVIEINVAAFIYGDVNGDGYVQIDDVSLALQLVLNDDIKTDTKIIKSAADVDGIEGITSSDVASILQKVLDSSYVFPVEK